MKFFERFRSSSPDDDQEQATRKRSQAEQELFEAAERYNTTLAHIDESKAAAASHAATERLDLQVESARVHAQVGNIDLLREKARLGVQNQLPLMKLKNRQPGTEDFREMNAEIEERTKRIAKINELVGAAEDEAERQIRSGT